MAELGEISFTIETKWINDKYKEMDNIRMKINSNPRLFCAFFAVGDLDLNNIF